MPLFTTSYNTVSQIAALIAGVTGSSVTSWTITVFDALAAQVATLAEGQELNLVDPATVKALIQLSTTGIVGIATETIDSLTTVVTTINQALDETQAGQTGADLVAAVEAVQKLAQGAISDELRASGGDPTQLQAIVDAYTGDNLIAAIAAARGSLGDVDGPVFQNTPVAVDDSATTPAGQGLVLGVAAVLANDTDADKDQLSVTTAGNGVHGTATLDIAKRPNASRRGERRRMALTRPCSIPFRKRQRER